MLVNDDNWQNLPPLDLATGIPKLLDETLACCRQITGFKPVLHLSAPTASPRTCTARSN
jgi:hypothetical protein